MSTSRDASADPESMAPTVLVIFGPTGDLMARKIVPSLYYLREKGQLPEKLRIVGFGRRDWGDAELRGHVRAILAERASHADPAELEEFLELFEYQRGEFHDGAAYQEIQRHVSRIESEWDVCANKLFYLAVPPKNYETILRNLASCGLCEERSDLTCWTRVLVEKPFGDDRDTARSLDALLLSLFREDQIYRIDHYLAKEMLQGIMNFRFANSLFEHEWNRNGIESIDITVLESIGAEKRGAFYDALGALRDVGQNHLLQMLALIAMDQPASMGADDIRAARAALIESLTPMTLGEVADNTFRAQSEGFREIAGVSAASDTETYFRLKTQLTGTRWAGVPVMMQSGKRMGAACKEIIVRMCRPEPCILCDDGLRQTNRIVFTLEPSDRIEIVFYTKKPGVEDGIEERAFSFFLYEKAEKAQYVEEYAKLLHDALAGDQTLFVSTREIDAGWCFIDPIVDGWEAGLVPLVCYPLDTDSVVVQAELALEANGRQKSIGVAGLGKMGAGLALNLIDRDWRVVGWNRHGEVATAMADEGLVAAATLRDLVAELPVPRVIWLMVPAGAPVDELLFGTGGDGAGGLAGLLAPGDTVIDGGNSFWRDAAPRAERLAELGIHFLDSGTSGGPAGARDGACLMIGGDRDVFSACEAMFADVALPGGYRFFDGHGAGHFVKMVHNGIEYGMMQAIAEGFALLHDGPFHLDLEEVAAVYQHGSVVESRLVGWLGEAYAELGSDLEGVSGVVGHTGECEWAIEAAHEFDVAVPITEGSLRFREESESKPGYVGQVLTAMRNAFGGHGLGPGGGPRR